MYRILPDSARASQICSFSLHSKHIVKMDKIIIYFRFETFPFQPIAVDIQDHICNTYTYIMQLGWRRKEIVINSQNKNIRSNYHSLIILIKINGLAVLILKPLFERVENKQNHSVCIRLKWNCIRFWWFSSFVDIEHIMPC